VLVSWVLAEAPCFGAGRGGSGRAPDGARWDRQGRGMAGQLPGVLRAYLLNSSQSQESVRSVMWKHLCTVMAPLHCKSSSAV